MAAAFEKARAQNAKPARGKLRGTPELEANKEAYVMPNDQEQSDEKGSRNAQTEGTRHDWKRGDRDRRSNTFKSTSDGVTVETTLTAEERDELVRHTLDMKRSQARQAATDAETAEIERDRAKDERVQDQKQAKLNHGLTVSRIGKELVSVVLGGFALVALGLTIRKGMNDLSSNTADNSQTNGVGTTGVRQANASLNPPTSSRKQNQNSTRY